jgi:PST family polysaccharide transporter
LFQIPNVAPVIQALALIFPIRSFSIVSEGLIQRQMRYKAMASMEFLSYLLGYAPFAIIAAAAGYGFWALAVGQIIQTLVLTVGLMVLGRHAMRPQLDGPIAREIARFGFGATLARFGNYIAMNADYFVVGRWLGPAALGIYTRAFYFVAQPTNLIGAVADKVLFPAMASIQDKHERLNRAYVRAIGIIAMVSFPVCAFLVALGPEIVLILLGPKWSATVVPFQILLFSLPFRTAYKLTSTLLRAAGFVYALALWQWIYAASVVLGAIAGSPFGINGVACGVSAAIILNFWIGLIFANVARQAPVASILGATARHLGVSIVILLGAMGVRYLGVAYGFPAIITVLLGGAVSMCLMLLIWFCSPRILGEEGQWLFGKADRSYRKVLELAGRPS